MRGGVGAKTLENKYNPCMFVYCIVAQCTPPIMKIGKAADIEKRMSQLQTGCPFDLKLEAAIKCKSEQHALAIEQAAHEYLAASRKRGEWFIMLHQKPSALIHFLKSVDNGTNTVETIRDQVKADKRERNREKRAKIRQRNREFLAQFRSTVG